MRKLLITVVLFVLAVFTVTACFGEDTGAEIDLLKEQVAWLTEERDLLKNRSAELELLIAAANDSASSTEQTQLPSDTSDSSASLPRFTKDDIDDREYSNDELQDMLSLPAEELRTEISTVSDAIVLLDMMFPIRFDGASNNWLGPGPISNDNFVGSYRFYSGEDVLHDRDVWINRAQPDNPMRYSFLGNIEAALAYLLSDNYEVGVLYGLYIDGRGDENGSPYAKTVNYVKIDGCYVIFRPLIEVFPSEDGPQVIERNYALPEMTVITLDEYVVNISEQLVRLINPLDQWLARFESFDIDKMPDGWVWNADWDWFDHFDIPPTPLIIFDHIGGYQAPFIIEHIYAIPGGQEFTVSNYGRMIEISPDVEPIFINPYYPYID